MMPITQNLMPMGKAAEQFSGNSSVLPPMPPGAPAPMPAAPNPATGGAGMPGFPAPSAPTKPPFDIVPQDDGSSLVIMNGRVIGLNGPPKIPKDFLSQPQGIPHAIQPPQ